MSITQNKFSSKSDLRNVVRLLLMALIVLTCVACQHFESSDPSELSGPGSDDERPNVVFLLVDDLRWDEVGYEGYPVATPNIDSLSSDGIRFDKAYVVSSLCSPSRASFLTGTYPHTNGVAGNVIDLDFEKMPTIASLLQGEGYETAMIGKWHMGGSAKPRPGFDYWYALPGQGRYVNPEFKQNDKEKGFTIEGYNTDIITDRALEFMDDNAHQPFYLHLSYKSVHQPFTPAPRHADTLDDTAFKIKSPNARKTRMTLRRKRAETLLSVDESVGRVVAYLREHDLLDNTVLVFTSDNGYLLGEHGFGDKRYFYEESIRIPWLVHYPRLTASGTAIDQPILNVDFLPSMLELVGADIPEHIQGASFVPLMTATDPAKVDWRDYWIYEYMIEQEYMHVPTHLAVVGKDYKYVRFPEGQALLKRFSGEELLFNTKTDPFEMTNIASEESSVEVLQKMRGQLQQFGQDTDFQFMPLDPVRVNKRIGELYGGEKMHTWFRKAMDKAYPEGYPGWEAPESEPL